MFNKVANTNTPNIVPVQGTFDQNGTNLSLVGPGGIQFKGPEFVPPSNDYAGIMAAYNAAVAAGGGTIQFLPITYTLSGPIPISNNINYQGAAYGFWDYQVATKGGTVLVGDGTFNCFEYNPTDKVYTSTVSTDIKSTEIFGAAINCLSIRNFSYGIKIGALYNGGCNQLQMDKIYVQGCTQWGIWLENCAEPNIGTISCMGNAVGNFYLGCSGNGWNYGDGVIKQLLIQAGVNGTGLLGSIQSRGAVFEARGVGSSLNDMLVEHIGINGWYGTTYSYSTTISSGNTAIPVSDLSKVAIASGITFGTTVGNITANYCYFVLSKSAATGSGTITISDQKGGTVITPSAGGTSTLSSKGGTLVEVGGNNYIGASNTVTAFTLTHSDVEETGTAAILLQNCQSGLSFSTSALTNNNGFVLRALGNSKGAYNKIYNQMGNTMDIDDNSKHTTIIGSLPLSLIQNRYAIGQSWVDSVDGLGIWLVGGTPNPDIYGGDSSAFISLNLNTPLAMYHQQNTNGSSFFSNGAKSNTGQVITYATASIGTMTLPSLAYAPQLGLPLYINNPTAFALTINTTGSQSIIGLGVSATSMIIAANSSAMVMGQQTGSTYYWARYA